MAGILWLAAAGWHFEYLTQIFNILDDGVAETKEFSTQNKERKNNFQCLLKVTLNTVQRTRPEECSIAGLVTFCVHNCHNGGVSRFT